MTRTSISRPGVSIVGGKRIWANVERVSVVIAGLLGSLRDGADGRDRHQPGDPVTAGVEVCVAKIVAWPWIGNMNALA
jgi:hypothetical protein